jgi:nucleoside-diphosphate-sugar epimerase
MRALVTGGTGFIGRCLVSELAQRKVPVTVLTRNPPAKNGALSADGVILHRTDLTASGSDLTRACHEANEIFHLAGYAHAADQDSPEVERLHQQTTVAGTRAILDAAISAKVRRFVFLSSVKAMGEGGEERLDESSPARPASAYGRAKRQAEEMVLEAGAKHGMHVAILRLPLVYGPGVKGNLRHMIEAIDRRRFPPLPETGNRRSMVDVRDVVQALLLAADKQAAAGKIFIVTDGKDYSTREIHDLICHALGQTVPHWSVPLILLRSGARIGDLIGRLRGRPFALNSESLSKLLGSACYSSDRIRRELGFVSRHTFESALPAMIAHYRTARDVN